MCTCMHIFSQIFFWVKERDLGTGNRNVTYRQFNEIRFFTEYRQAKILQPIIL